MKESPFSLTQNCRFFNGYKPCTKNLNQENSSCHENCPHLDIPQHSVLVVHLGAMGAVLRSTALLPAIKKKFPSSFITWVTEEHTRPLLAENPLVDRVLSITARDQLVLAGMKFDVGYFIDKSPEMAGLQQITRPKQSFGFTAHPLTGAVLPLTAAAQNLWELGLDNHQKFFENKRSEISLIAEALELPFNNEEYIVGWSAAELALTQQRIKDWSKEKSEEFLAENVLKPSTENLVRDSKPISEVRSTKNLAEPSAQNLMERTKSNRKILIGLNTGTSGVLPYKTIPTEFWKRLIKDLKREVTFPLQIVLLGGGSSDHQNNLKIANELREELTEEWTEKVIVSPALLGLRDGLCSVKAMDLVVTADSLGMHMAIACQKPVVVWFGPTCAHEIELYGRGIKIESSYACSPCWKRNCQKSNPCNQALDTGPFIQAIQKLLSTQDKAFQGFEALFINEF